MSQQKEEEGYAVMPHVSTWGDIMSGSMRLLLLSCLSFYGTSMHAAPGVGAHALAYYLYQQTNATVLATSPITTHASGSTIIVGVGRGDAAGFAAFPTDNKGNGSYKQLGVAHRYTNWANSGTALYACSLASGGSGHVVSVGVPKLDETTMAVVEITGGGVIQDVVWSEVLRPNTLTSRPVTTTGPATLVAFWFGDAGVSPQHAEAPGWLVLDSLFLNESMVQCAVAVKSVPVAGTYTVTWTATPAQGAQLWLVAVQPPSTSTGVKTKKTRGPILLNQNYPNPFNASTEITYIIPDDVSGHASLEIFDGLGRFVSSIADGEASPGVSRVGFHAGALASGMYLYRLSIEPQDPSERRWVSSRSFLLIK